MFAQPRSLAHVPDAHFVSIMGMGVLSLTWKSGARLWEVFMWTSDLILMIVLVARIQAGANLFAAGVWSIWCLALAIVISAVFTNLRRVR